MMGFFDFSFWQNFGSNLLATLIGVALGIPVAFWINKRVEANTEKENKARILRVLLDDLLHIKSFVDGWQARAKKMKKTVPRADSLTDETWRAFSDGGELQWIRDPVLLRRLAMIYARINFIKYLSEKHWDLPIYGNLITFILFPVPANNLENALRENMDLLESSIAKTIALVKENLE
jgi:hypothetical protein